jgi:hypothetical protein
MPDRESAGRTPFRSFAGRGGAFGGGDMTVDILIMRFA